MESSASVIVQLLFLHIVQQNVDENDLKWYKKRLGFQK